MEEKQRIWLEKRIGCISASEVHLLMSKSGKFTATNISYLRKIERQRFLNEPAPPVYSKSLSFGTENEPYAIEWLRANTDWDIIHCDVDMEEKGFVKTDWGLGVSPDAFKMNSVKIENLIEVKCVFGDGETDLIFSPSTPYWKKKKHVFNNHKDQLGSQLLAYPRVDSVIAFKYDPQSDENEFDLRSPLDPSRGIIFEFSRSDFGDYLDKIKEKVLYSNEYLDSGKDLDLINKNWKYGKAASGE